MFTVKLTARAKRELKIISQRHQESLGLIFEELKEDPFIGKPLSRELTGKFSYRIGLFRIIYQVNIQNKTVLVISAGHREIVYN